MINLWTVLIGIRFKLLGFLTKLSLKPRQSWWENPTVHVCCRAKREETPCLPYVGAEVDDVPTERWTGCFDADELLKE